MAPCNHTEWLKLYRDREQWFLLCNRRLESLVSDMRDARAQYPSLLFFVGKKCKSHTLRHIFPRNNHAKRRGQGIVTLHIDSTFAESERPLLFADAEPGTKPFDDHVDLHECHDVERHPLEWATQESRANQLADVIFPQLLFPFTDILCLFADDFGGAGRAASGLAEVVAQLKLWVANSQGSDPIRPRLVVVGSRIAHDQDDASVLENLPDLAKCFSGIRLFRLVDKLSPEARAMQVKDALLSELDLVRRMRIADRTSFSAVHLNAFFHAALVRTAATIKEPFDFVLASRRGNVLDASFASHLTAFLQLCNEKGVPTDSVVSYVASIILLDCTPRGSHAFHPRLVFRSLYLPFCQSAFASNSNASEALVPERWCRLVEDQFHALSTERETSNVSAPDVHRNTIAQLLPGLAELKSNTFCLFCLRRKAEHVFACGHAGCDVCVRIFGAPIVRLEYRWEACCLFNCKDRGKLVVRLMPPTAGSRVLTIDGGGVRVEVSLLILRELWKTCALSYSLCHEVDFVMGTSAGGIAALLVVLVKHSILGCLFLFRASVNQVFEGRPAFFLPWFIWLFNMLACLMTDGWYDAAKLEDCLQGTFGPNRRLFDTPKYGLSGTKVAVTATSTTTNTLCILSNYNGVRERSETCGYRHIRPSNPEEEMYIWEAARATSAAPFIFPAKQIYGVGHLQDGGVGKHNNPVDPASWESRIALDTDPDLMISVGSGFAVQPNTPVLARRRRGIRDGFVFRAVRSFMSGLCGEKTHMEHQNQMGNTETDEYIRFNVLLEAETPLDDLQSLPTLRAQTDRYISSQRHLFLAVARYLYATSFFFELSKSTFHGQEHEFQGYVRCRSKEPRELLTLLSHRFPSARFATCQGVVLGAVSLDDICDSCGLYGLPVLFHAHRRDSMKIILHFNELYSRKISGFPHSMEWFEERQGFGDVFGRPDHADPAEIPRARCSCVKGARTGTKRKALSPNHQPRKRAVSFADQLPR